MALTKDKKNQVVDEVKQLLEASKLTVIAAYQGTSVKALQELRKQARSGGTTIRVVKNNLFIKVLEQSPVFNSTDKSALKGMLLYAFNANDEVAPAQTLASFAKNQPSLLFVGAINPEGLFINAADVAALASLPSKEVLRGQLIGTFNAPLTGFVSMLNNNVRGILNVLSARAELIK